MEFESSVRFEPSWNVHRFTFFDLKVPQPRVMDFEIPTVVL